MKLFNELFDSKASKTLKNNMKAQKFFESFKTSFEKLFMKKLS